MAKRSNTVNANKKPKYSTRAKSVCNICGRNRAFMRKFGVCRICFRELAMKGELPGVTKASW